ncbi:hypothetical protein AQ922_15100 [Burkholderia pseudomallei]|nr:hypothetical protein AQ922_15100 [Burkholderia pseudomallei]
MIVMHNQYSLHVGQLIFAQRPRLATFSTPNADVQDSLSSSVQVEIGAGSCLASHKERKIDDSQ